MKNMFEVIDANQKLLMDFQNKGIENIAQIVAMTEKEFISKYSSLFGKEPQSEKDALLFYQKACKAIDVISLLRATYFDYGHGVYKGPHVATSQEKEETTPLKLGTELEKSIVSYDNIFKQTKTYKVPEFWSVFSPAAYLVDLIRFIRQYIQASDGKSGYDEIIIRRPDLINITLTEENTTTIIKKIDLVNQVLLNALTNNFTKENITQINYSIAGKQIDLILNSYELNISTLIKLISLDVKEEKSDNDDKNSCLKSLNKYNSAILSSLQLDVNHLDVLPTAEELRILEHPHWQEDMKPSWPYNFSQNSKAWQFLVTALDVVQEDFDRIVGLFKTENQDLILGLNDIKQALIISKLSRRYNQSIASIVNLILILGNENEISKNEHGFILDIETIKILVGLFAWLDKIQVSLEIITYIASDNQPTRLKPNIITNINTSIADIPLKTNLISNENYLRDINIKYVYLFADVIGIPSDMIIDLLSKRDVILDENLFIQFAKNNGNKLVCNKANLEMLNRVACLIKLFSLTRAELNSILINPSNFDFDINPNWSMLQNIWLSKKIALQSADKNNTNLLFQYLAEAKNLSEDSSQKLTTIMGWSEYTANKVYSLLTDQSATVDEVNNPKNILEIARIGNMMNLLNNRSIDLSIEFFEILRKLDHTQSTSSDDIGINSTKALAISSVQKNLADCLENNLTQNIYQISQENQKENDTLVKTKNELVGKIKELKRDKYLNYIFTNFDKSDFFKKLKINALNNGLTSRILYEYFLLDPEVSARVTCSVIEEAIEAVQLYISRCQMNLENARLTDAGIENWSWMQHYRLWQANREVFLYPENYLKPDIRKGKTSQFEILERALKKTNLDAASIDSSFEEYAQNFVEIADLIITGVYINDAPENKSVEAQAVLRSSTNPYVNQKLLENKAFIIARSKTDSYQYYYRCADYVQNASKSYNFEFINWQPWIKINITIASPFAYPVFAFNRLFIFWIEFISEPSSRDDNNKFQNKRFKPILKYSFYNFDGSSWVSPQTIELPGHINNDFCWDDENGKIVNPDKPNAYELKVYHSFPNLITCKYIPTKYIYNKQPHKLIISIDHDFNYNIFYSGESSDTPYNPDQPIIDLLNPLFPTNHAPNLLTNFTYASWDNVKLCTMENDLYVLRHDFGENSKGNGVTTFRFLHQGNGIYDWQEIEIKNKSPFATEKGGIDWADKINEKKIKPIVFDNTIYLVGLAEQKIQLWKLIKGYDEEYHYWENLIKELDIPGWSYYDGDPDYNELFEAIVLDNQLYLVLRTPTDGIRLYLLSSTSPRLLEFKNKIFLDSEGWGTKRSFETIQTIICRDELYILGTSGKGLFINKLIMPKSQSDQFEWRKLIEGTPKIFDSGWEYKEYYRTIKAVVFLDDIYIVGREANGLQMYKLIENELNTWKIENVICDTHIFGNEKSDGGWFVEEKYRTIQIIAYDTGIFACGYDHDKNVFYIHEILSAGSPYKIYTIEFGNTFFDTAKIIKIKDYFFICNLTANKLQLYSATFPIETYFSNINDVKQLHPFKEDIKQFSKLIFAKGVDGIMGPFVQRLQYFDYIINANAEYFWELFFFAPLLVANHYQTNGQYEQAQKWLHYIFKPISATSDSPTMEQMWRFKGLADVTLEGTIEQMQDTRALSLYHNDPFDPHAIASIRKIAYQKNVVMTYIDNIIKWGDQLFEQDTRESLTLAKQLYVLAYNLLGNRPSLYAPFGLYGDKLIDSSADTVWSLDGDNVEFYTRTIQSVEYNGSLHITMRNKNGIEIYKLIEKEDNESYWYGLPLTNQIMADNTGWLNQIYSSTIRLVVFNNELCVIGKGTYGILIWRIIESKEKPGFYQGQEITNINNTIFSNEENGKDGKPITTIWGDATNGEAYCSTIKAIVFHEKLYCFARSNNGIIGYRLDYDPMLNVYSWKELFPNVSDSTKSIFSDVSGWNQAKYYTTINLAVLNNKICVLARSESGIIIHELQQNIDGTNKFVESYTTSNPLFPDFPPGNSTDKTIWGNDSDVQYSSTINSVVLNEELYIIARSTKGMEAYKLEPYQENGHQYKWVNQLPTTSENYKDSDHAIFGDGSWGSPKYYSTIRSFVFKGAIHVVARSYWGVLLYKLYQDNQNGILANNWQHQISKCNVMPVAESLSGLLANNIPLPDFLIESENTVSNIIKSTDTTNPKVPNLLDFYFHIPINLQFEQYWDTVKLRLYNLRHSLNIDSIYEELPLFSPAIDPNFLVAAASSDDGFRSGGGLSNNQAPTIYRYVILSAKAKEAAANVIQFGQSLLSALEKKDVAQLEVLRNSYEGVVFSSTISMKQDQIKFQQAGLNSLQASLNNSYSKLNYYTSIISAGLLETEREQISLTSEAITMQAVTAGIKMASAIGHMVPTVFGFADGAFQPGEAIAQAANIVEGASGILLQEAGLMGVKSEQARRMQEWGLQAQLAKLEIQQIQHDIVTKQAEISISQRELRITQIQVEQVQKIDQFLKSKFTNANFYSWIISNLSGLYTQYYAFAEELALLAQQAYQFELEDPHTNYIRSTNWNSLYQGLFAGEGLMLQLQEMDNRFLAANKRKMEIAKDISIKQINPNFNSDGKAVGTMLKLDTVFTSTVEQTYLKSMRIKSIAVTIPGVIAPYKTIIAELSLGTEKVIISRGINDSGLFEINYNDERYLPFEGMKVSDTTVDVKFNDPDLAKGITDVIIHLKYTILKMT